MSDSERNLCLVRQMEAGLKAADSGTELEPDSDIVRAVDTPAEFACMVGGCAVTGQYFLDYIKGYGAPRN